MPHSRDRKQWYARYSAGDLSLAAAGLALAVGSAVFPWYIFYNQDQFGVRALEFKGDTEAAGGKGLSPRSRLFPELLSPPDLTPPELQGEFDPVATGTLPADGAPRMAPGVDEQPFPSRPGDFRLVHVANSRAMIEDERGLWIVGPGSILPDESRVSAIERRAGRWVLVTDAGRVVAISE